jgi:hypothetical protein
MDVTLDIYMRQLLSSQEPFITTTQLNSKSRTWKPQFLHANSMDQQLPCQAKEPRIHYYSQCNKTATLKPGKFITAKQQLWKSFFLEQPVI